MANINELVSIVEEQCFEPAINLSRFPNKPNFYAWSGSPYIDSSNIFAWIVNLGYGGSGILNRSSSNAVRLVRGGN